MKVFMEEYCLENKEGIRAILNAVDRQYQQQQQEEVRDDRVGNNMLLKKLESAQFENQALKAHLLSQLEGMRQENRDLKRSLESSSATCALVNQLQSEVQELKTKLTLLEAPVQPNTADLRLKQFNAMPKQLKQFYKQMKHGDDQLPPFSDLELYKTNKSTKGAYCKRKAIFHYMESCSEGIDIFLENHQHLSPLQLYEQCIKKSRQCK